MILLLPNKLSEHSMCMSCVVEHDMDAASPFVALQYTSVDMETFDSTLTLVRLINI